MELKKLLRIIVKYGLGIFALISTIIIPTIIFVNLLSVNELAGIDTFIIRFGQVLLIELILGFFITSIAFILVLYESFLRIRLFLSIFVEVLYIIYLIVWSQLGDIYISSQIGSQYISLNLNISILNFFFIGIPFLVILRNVFMFNLRRRKWKYIYTVVKIIEKEDIRSSTELSRVIQRSNLYSYEDDIFIIATLLKNIPELLLQLENNKYIFKMNNYRLTKKGKNIIKKLEKINIFKSILLQLYSEKKFEKLEVWTEEELAKLKK